MKKQFDILLKTRQHAINTTLGLSLDQLNEIPAGFNNNIAWNLGHLVASQQGLCYTRAGLPMKIDSDFHETYKPRTKPSKNVDQKEIDTIRELCLGTISALEKDYQAGIFTNYSPWVNMYGIEISNIEDVINYVIFHEGLHLGYVMSLKKMIRL